jgi:broad specificity phosphatase PhoE
MDTLEGAKAEIDKTLAEDDGSEAPVYVMRHGRTALDADNRSDGWLDFPLTDDGRRGIMPAQQFLKSLPQPVACIYYPSLKRTTETADIIKSGMGSKPAKMIVSDEARTWNLGVELIGSKKIPAKPIVKFYMRHPDKTPKDGESLNDFRKRFLTWFKEQLTEEKDGPVLLIVSGSNIREISQYLTGNRDLLDLDEGGLLKLQPIGNMWHGHIIMGGKDTPDEES